MKKTRFGFKSRISSLFTLTEILAVSAIISSVPLTAFVRAKQKAVETECMNNMRQVGAAIVSYHLSNGEYPKAAFFPENPKSGADSIRVVLAEELGGDKVWLCPAMPEKLKEKGLTWVYNDTLSGKQSTPDPSKTWILVEFSCVSRSAPEPHPGGYNIVYADGHVVTSRTLPEDITKNQQAMIERLEKEFQLAVAE